LDVVLTDIVMPGIDGLGVLVKIKQKDESLPVIMLSAHEDQRLVINALRRGAYDYQRKPISPHELALAVDRALEYSKLQKDKKRKLARLSNLENGARQLAEMVPGQVPLESIAREYDLLQSSVKMVSEILECDRVSIMLLDPKDETLKIAVSVGFSKSLIKEETRPAKKSVSAEVLETGEAILVEDVDTDERVKQSEFASQYKTNSFVIAPLRVGEQVVGTICANDKTDRASFSEDDLMLLKTASYHVSSALSHAIHSTALERERQRLSRLAEFQKILIHYLEPDEMLAELLKKCQEMLNVVSASVFLKDEFSDDFILKVGFNGTKPMTRAVVIPAGESITGTVGRQGALMAVNNPEKHPVFIGETEWPGKGVIRNLLAAPIKLSGTTIGVIRLLNKRGDVFTRADAQLIEDLADSLAIAIRNLKLYEQLNHSVEEIVGANRDLQKLNDDLKSRARELAALKKQLGIKNGAAAV
jgi:GAF domain-containing protein